MNDIKGYIDSVTHTLMKREHERTNGVGNPPIGKIVSSNTNFKKYFKTHGTGSVQDNKNIQRKTFMINVHSVILIVINEFIII